MSIVFIVPWYLGLISATKMNHSLFGRRCLLHFKKIFSWRKKFEASLRHHNSCYFKFRLLLHLFFLIIYSVFLCINHYILGYDINYIQMQFCYITFLALMLLKTKNNTTENLPDTSVIYSLICRQWDKKGLKVSTKTEDCRGSSWDWRKSKSLSFKYARKTIPKIRNNS